MPQPTEADRENPDHPGGHGPGQPAKQAIARVRRSSERKESGDSGEIDRRAKDRQPSEGTRPCTAEGQSGHGNEKHSPGSSRRGGQQERDSVQCPDRLGRNGFEEQYGCSVDTKGCAESGHEHQRAPQSAPQPARAAWDQIRDQSAGEDEERDEADADRGEDPLHRVRMVGVEDADSGWPGQVGEEGNHQGHRRPQHRQRDTRQSSAPSAEHRAAHTFWRQSFRSLHRRLLPCPIEEFDHRGGVEVKHLSACKLAIAHLVQAQHL